MYELIQSLEENAFALIVLWAISRLRYPFAWTASCRQYLGMWTCKHHILDMTNVYLPSFWEGTLTKISLKPKPNKIKGMKLRSDGVERQMVIVMWTSYNSNTVRGISNICFPAEDSDACKQPDTKSTGMKRLIIVHRGPWSLIQSPSYLCKFTMCFEAKRCYKIFVVWGPEGNNNL